MVHTVYFWLKEEYQTTEGFSKFEQALSKLVTIEGCVNAHYGKPAAVPHRPVIDNTWDYALSITFDSVETHNRYQSHPVHLEFIETNKVFWKEVKVTDMQIIN